MKVSLDSNVWEVFFDPDYRQRDVVLSRMQAHVVKGFICETGFRIEAIAKRRRAAYFAAPHMRVTTAWEHAGGRDFAIRLSIGPDDAVHPGLPDQQLTKLRRAFSAGVKLMRGQSWLGLPTVPALRDGQLFVTESPSDTKIREQKQIDISEKIEARGVGKAIFDAAGGWEKFPASVSEEKILVRACAEWADAELVAAHIAYGHDILCTNDRAKSAGRSVFDQANRAWLEKDYGVRVVGLDELISLIQP